MFLNNVNTNENEAITTDVAAQMLQNIFDACDVEPNTISLEDLVSYSNYRRDRYKVRKILVIVIMVLFLLLPFMFISPKITGIAQTQDVSPTFKMSVESILPIKSVTATIDGENVPVYETQTRQYSIEPGKEGTMTVTVKLINGQYVTKKVKVTNVDIEAPSVASHSRSGSYIYIYLEDDISGVDWDSIKALDASGKEVKPAKIDSDAGYVAFNYPTSAENIYISDKAGNQLQLLLDPTA